ncbi:MAG: hypothetical protein AAF806_17240 [Bacteroidota bacterium]
MKRKQVPQLINQAWFPSFLRNCIHEFMTWFVNKIGAAKPFLPVIEKGLLHSKTKKIINIDSQVGAGFETLEPHLPENVEIVNIPLEQLAAEQEGLYVQVNAFHQLSVVEARKLLTKISENGQPLAIVEGNNDSLWQVVGMTIFVPLTIILTAPFVKPFRIGRLVFTYLLPILPFVTFLDGFLALFKLYAPKDLDELVSTVNTTAYEWESGKMDNGRGGKIIYLLGFPT